MWSPKRWEIESGHIRISSWVQGERRRRRRSSSYNGTFDCRLLDLQARVVESQRAKDQLEKMVYSLTDELRTIRHKTESQQSEFNTVITDLRLRSRRLEEENKLQVLAKRFLFPVSRGADSHSPTH
jgi:predicted  nucleic acid-binding Zn-ribbon protein